MSNGEDDIVRRELPRRSALGLGVLGLAGLALAACSSNDKSSSSGSSTTAATSDDPKAIATDAYIFGYPLVLMELTRVTGAPTNRFYHAEVLPTADDRSIVRMNRDTLYSQAWLDVAPEPVVLQIPEINDRYWLMPLLDMWSNVRHNPGSKHLQLKDGQPSTPPYTYAITGPDWKGNLPEGVTELKMPTNRSWLLGRIQVKGDADVEAVKAIQAKMLLMPLSQWNSGHRAAEPSAAPQDPAASPPKQVEDMDGRTFFNKLCELLKDNPATPEDAAAMARFAKIGVTPGGNVDNQPADLLAAAAAEAKKQIPAWTADPGAKDLNGWLFTTDTGTYGTSYMLRANVAWKGLGANLPEDAVYPTNFINVAAGTPSKNYRLHFPPGGLPPTDAFWSLTAYDADNFLVGNPARIYSLGNESTPAPNPDGSVDIAVQATDPGGAVPQGNWLPIPADGTFSITLRMYAPKPEVLDGTWKPPALTPAN